MFLEMYNGNTYKKHTMVLSWLFRHSITSITMVLSCTMAVLWYT